MHKVLNELKNEMVENLEQMTKEFKKSPTTSLNSNIHMVLKNIKCIECIEDMLEDEGGEERTKKSMWS